MRVVYPILIAILLVVVVGLAMNTFKVGLFSSEPSKIISNHDIVLEKIEELGKLELVKYKFRDVLEHKQEYDYWFDSKAILIISGEAVGCIDLTKIKDEDVFEAQDTVYVKLPEAELCYAKINHKETRIYNTSSYSMDNSKLIGDAFKAAEKQITRTALESNILEQAQQNGERLLKTLFEDLTDKKVVFTKRPELPDENIRLQ